MSEQRPHYRLLEPLGFEWDNPELINLVKSYAQQERAPLYTQVYSAQQLAQALEFGFVCAQSAPFKALDLEIQLYCTLMDPTKRL